MYLSVFNVYKQMVHGQDVENLTYHTEVCEIYPRESEGPLKGFLKLEYDITKFGF